MTAPLDNQRIDSTSGTSTVPDQAAGRDRIVLSPMGVAVLGGEVRMAHADGLAHPLFMSRPR
jgi:hypothetical protein